MLGPSTDIALLSHIANVAARLVFPLGFIESREHDLETSFDSRRRLWYYLLGMLYTIGKGDINADL